MENLIAGYGIKKAMETGKRKLNKVKPRKLIKKIKGAAFVVLLIASLGLSAQFVRNLLNVSGNQTEVIQTEVTQVTTLIPSHLKTAFYVVGEGDTAWNLQSQLTYNDDIEEMILLLNDLNGKDVSQIAAGETITVLVYK